MACDYCKKIVNEVEPLRNSFKTRNVKLVCSDCGHKISKKKDFFMFTMMRKRLKTWIERTRKK